MQIEGEKDDEKFRSPRVTKWTFSSSKHIHDSRDHVAMQQSNLGERQWCED
jgi:hypothetical protein